MLPKDIFKRHQHIGLDLDETLSSSTQDMLQELHRKWYFLSITDMDSLTEFDWTLLPECDLTSDELQSFWGSHMLDTCQPIEHSQWGVGLLIQYHKTFSLITARNDIDHSDDTKKWIWKFFPNIFDDRIFFANHSRERHVSKSSICQTHGITLMIDDGLHNALDLVEHGIVCILLDKPWNRQDTADHPLIHRARDWQEIIDNLATK